MRMGSDATILAVLASLGAGQGEPQPSATCPHAIRTKQSLTGQVGQIHWACSTTDTAMWQTHSWSVSLLVQDHRLWLPIRLVKRSGVMGFEPPTWHAVLHGARPPFPDEFEPGPHPEWNATTENTR